MRPTDQKDEARYQSEPQQPSGGFEGEPVVITLGDLQQPGWLARPAHAHGAVVFSQSTHEQGGVAGHWAQALTRFGIATVLLELLSPHEGKMEPPAEPQKGIAAGPRRGAVGGIDRVEAYGLARRLDCAVRWTRKKMPDLPVALCGLGTDGITAVLRNRRAKTPGWERLAGAVLFSPEESLALGRDAAGEPPLLVLDLEHLPGLAGEPPSLENESPVQELAVHRVSMWLLDRFHDNGRAH